MYLATADALQALCWGRSSPRLRSLLRDAFQILAAPEARVQALLAHKVFTILLHQRDDRVQDLLHALLLVLGAFALRQAHQDLHTTTQASVQAASYAT